MKIKTSFPNSGCNIYDSSTVKVVQNQSHFAIERIWNYFSENHVSQCNLVKLYIQLRVLMYLFIFLRHYDDILIMWVENSYNTNDKETTSCI